MSADQQTIIHTRIVFTQTMMRDGYWYPERPSEGADLDYRWREKRFSDPTNDTIELEQLRGNEWCFVQVCESVRETIGLIAEKRVTL